MQNYNTNNYGAIGGYGGQPVRGNAGMNYGTMNYGGNNWGGSMWTGAGQVAGVPAQMPDQRVYVNGRAGADAYPIPMGVNQIILWDTEAKRFYIKGYDNNGIPRVLEDNDYGPHEESEVAAQRAEVDLSAYATKDDMRAMVADAMKKFKTAGTSGYITKEYLNKVLSDLCVGNGGRVVRSSDVDA